MAKSLARRGAIEATTVYCNDVLVCVNSSMTLPSITFLTADLQAMGTMTLPLIASIEDMETSITKVGIDKNLTLLTSPGDKRLEYRWVQDVVQADGTIKPEGCKAFFKIMPKTLVPGATLEVGSATENDLTFSVTRYQLFAGGKELVLVDRLNQILRVNGVDYYKKLDSML